MAACPEHVIDVQEAIALEREGARGRPRRRPSARMVRRRRRTALVALALGAGVLFLLGGGPEGEAVASRSGAPRSVLVRPGQTVWEIAERYAPPGVDPRAYVDAVVRLNHLDGGLPAGVRLRLPG